MGSKKYATKQEHVAEAHASSVIIERAPTASVALEITGTAPLIQNAFSQKALEQMLRKHMGIGVEREKKKPSEVVEAAIIRNLEGKACIPPTAIKKAMLTASKMVKLQKTSLRVQLYVEGQSIPITYEKMSPRMDMVRTSGMSRTPDVRFRPIFEGWKARLILQFADTLQVQTVVDLLDRAGNVGVGEWRPEKDGSFGTFRVTRNIVSPDEVSDVREACASPLRGLVIPPWALDAEIDPSVLQRISDAQYEEEATE